MQKAHHITLGIQINSNPIRQTNTAELSVVYMLIPINHPCIYTIISCSESLIIRYYLLCLIVHSYLMHHFFEFFFNFSFFLLLPYSHSIQFFCSVISHNIHKYITRMVVYRASNAIFTQCILSIVFVLFKNIITRDGFIRRFYEWNEEWMNWSEKNTQCNF